jgi:hypothetical protein
MADNLTTQSATLATVPDASVIATDEVASAHYQKIKLDVGGDGVSIPATGDATNGLDVDVTRVQGTVTVSGTVTATPTGTQNVDVTANTIGLATGAKQDTGNTSIASVDTKTPALGQALAAASTPVVLTAAQVTTLTPPAAISGFSTETTLTSLNSKVTAVNTGAVVLAAGTALVGKAGIDQTTPGTTNNTTNRDVTYAKFVCDAGTLVASTLETASLTVSGFTAVEIEITNINGASTIYYTFDGTTPSSTNFSGILPATPSSIVLPCNGTPTLKLISAGTPLWGAVVRGV